MKQLLLLTAIVFLAPCTAGAQFPDLPFDSKSFLIEQLSDTHLRLIDEVELSADDNAWQLIADQIDIHTDTSELVATGNVVFTTAEARIAAERVDFNTEDQTAVFYGATGSVNMGDEVDRSMFGTQEPDMIFYGEKIERLGPRTYRLTKGAFTSCIQPTPRWQVVVSSLTMNLDQYALMRNAVIEVKGVPVFYLPLMYYPIQEDGRATGFLMPTYGASTYRGTSLSNAFFLAISRSQDATVFYDWFAQTGQGLGGEYRLTRGGGSEGYVRTYFLNERAAEISSGGGTTLLPARRSYELRGQGTQRIGNAWTARGQINYFSDITVQQTYQHNIYEASSRERSFASNLAGRFDAYQIGATLDVNETFFGDTQSTRWGSGPRVSAARGKSEIRGTGMYYSFNAEYARLLRVARRFRQGVTVESDSGLNRFDFNPTVQIPFTKWPFLTIDTTAQWRGTYWTERIDLDTRTQIPEGIGRSFIDLQSRATGPSFVKIWETPNSGYAERIKHVIEPWVSIRRVSAIDNFAEIVRLEGIDSVVGSVTQIRYGLDNRMYAKRREGGPEGVPREILNVSIMQSFYTDARAAEFDRRFRTSFNGTGAAPSNYSPVSIIARTEPTQTIGGTLRAEYDTQFMALRTIGAEGTYEVGGWLETRGGWSQRRFIEELPGFNDPRRLDHYLNSFTAVRSPGNAVGGTYSFNYDLLRSRYLLQRIMVYYNAQCCGVSFEYQSFNFEGLGSRAPVPQDRRFNVSFTLAGLGTFANVLGAFGGGGPGGGSFGGGRPGGF